MSKGRLTGRLIVEFVVAVYLAVGGFALSDPRGGSPLWFFAPFACWILFRIVLAILGWDIVGSVLDLNERLERVTTEHDRAARSAGPSPSQLSNLLFGCLGLFLILYGIALLGAQSWHWLESAEWVAVPAATVMISEDYRGSDEPAPLRLVPALGGKVRTGEPSSDRGRMLGWEKIKEWLADLPLALWAVVLGVGVLVVSSRD